mgnify:CR=1 FL=1
MGIDSEGIPSGQASNRKITTSCESCNPKATCGFRMLGMIPYAKKAGRMFSTPSVAAWTILAVTILASGPLMADSPKTDRTVKFVDLAGKKHTPLAVPVMTAPAMPVAAGGADPAWKRLGIKVDTVSAEAVSKVNKDLRGGLLITEVNADSPAARAGFARGDMLIGLHQWETITLDNISFVLNHPDLASFSPVRYFLIRDGQLRRGFLPGIE